MVESSQNTECKEKYGLPLNLRVYKHDLFVFNYFSGHEAIAVLQNKSVKTMLQGVFPDLESWFDFDAIANVREKAVAVLTEDATGHPSGFVHARQESLINGPEGKDKWVFSILAAAKQGEGIGSKLVESLKHEILLQGGKYLYARTDPSRLKTVQFYQKHGFQVDGEIGHYYYGPTPAVWLWTELKKPSFNKKPEDANIIQSSDSSGHWAAPNSCRELMVEFVSEESTKEGYEKS